MTKKDRREDANQKRPPSEGQKTPFQRFEELAKRLVRVPKSEVKHKPSEQP